MMKLALGLGLSSVLLNIGTAVYVQVALEQVVAPEWRMTIIGVLMILAVAQLLQVRSITMRMELSQNCPDNVCE